MATHKPKNRKHIPDTALVEALTCFDAGLPMKEILERHAGCRQDLKEILQTVDVLLDVHENVVVPRAGLENVLKKTGTMLSSTAHTTRPVTTAIVATADADLQKTPVTPEHTNTTRNTGTLLEQIQVHLERLVSVPTAALAGVLIAVIVGGVSWMHSRPPIGEQLVLIELAELRESLALSDDTFAAIEDDDELAFADEAFTELFVELVSELLDEQDADTDGDDTRTHIIPASLPTSLDGPVQQERIVS